MESTNIQEEEYHHHLHHQHQQVHDEVVAGSSNSSLASSCFSIETNHHAWRIPNFLLLNNSNNIHANGEEKEATTNSLTNSMIQNIGYSSWADPSNMHDNQQPLTSNKLMKQQESSSTSSSSDHHPHNNNSGSSSTFPADISTSPSDLLLLNTLSQNYKHPMRANPDLLHRSSLHQGGNKGVTTNFSQIFPSVNISNLGSNNNNNSNSNIHELVLSPTTMEVSHDLQGSFDVFATARLLNGGVDPSNSHLLELFKLDHHHHQLQQQQSSELKLWNNANNLSPFNNNGVLESKRSSCIVEARLTDHQHNQMMSKKPRFDARSSCPPFKVRKEKLGDRIAALQQLVAPFGKTDTASVLMEAFGYIKFLQNQVETLSVPYMKLPSRNKFNINSQRGSEEHSDSEEQKPDLKSRGLCLVPLSCMTYLASDACNAGLWPSPNFHPGL